MGKDNKIGRILWYDPNPKDNTIINTEDLSIVVNLTTQSKPRGVIVYDGTNNTGKYQTNYNANEQINFLDGSIDSNGNRHLTTKYTDINTTLSVDGNDDFEGLGIESIDIEFNTAYTPIIKIKFIDIRGGAIFGKGNKSKYRMFFDLPYPIFQLTIKGFYGKAVKYCLHLTRWNAEFNSDTGNFEIQCDFIGYTYALLTDLLSGLFRAAAKTKAGQDLLQEERLKYIPEIQPSIISIEELLTRIGKVNNLITNIKEQDADVINLRKSDFLNEKLDSIQSALDTLGNDLYGITGDDGYFNSKGLTIIQHIKDAINPTTFNTYTVTSEIPDKIDKLINNFVGTINKDIEDFNQSTYNNITINKLLFKVLRTNRYTPLLGEDIFAGEDELSDTLVQIVDGYDNTSPESRAELSNIAKSISGIESKITANDEMAIFDVTRAYSELVKIKKQLVSDESELRKSIGEKLADESKAILGFEPTIKNIIRILTIHGEILLKLLYTVSKDASTNPERTAALNLLPISNNNTNINKNQPIYPWPEYREVDDLQGGAVEKWLGTNIIRTNDVNEIVFVEELLQELLKIIKSDKVAELEDERGIIAWYPITTLDTKLDRRMTENPYTTALRPRTIPNEATRVLLLRAFLFMGIGSIRGYDDNLITLKGKLEAQNLIDACNKLSYDSAKIITDAINTYIDFNSILKYWGAPTEPDDRPIYILDAAGNYEYNYIRYFNDDNNAASYIPVNGSFDGSDFFESATMIKTYNDLEPLSEKIIWATSNAYDTNIINGIEFYSPLDYERESMKPVSQPLYYDPEVTALGVDLTNENAKEFLNKTPSGKLKNLNPYKGQYLANQFSEMKYQYNNDKNYGLTEDELYSTVLAFYAGFNDRDMRRKSGTYLSAKRIWNKNPYTITKNEFTTATFEIFKDTVESKLPKNKRYSDFWPDFGKQKYLMNNLLTDNSLVISLPFIEFAVSYQDYAYADEQGSRRIAQKKDPRIYSLFGSSLYYGQNGNKLAKAFLFLHTIPWNGVTALEDDADMFNDVYSTDDTVNLKMLFTDTEAFIKAPELWIAFIGGILWRYEEVQDPITWTYNNESLIPRQWSDGLQEWRTAQIPRTWQYLYSLDTPGRQFGISFTNQQQKIGDLFYPHYKRVDSNLRNLPESVKTKFIEYFKNWAENTFEPIRPKLEIMKEGNDLRAFSALYANVITENELNKDKVKSLKYNAYGIDGFKENILYNYIYVSPIIPEYLRKNQTTPEISDANFYLELRDYLSAPNGAMGRVVNWFKKTVYIHNPNPYTFNYYRRSSKVFVSKDDMKLFLTSFLNEFKQLTKDGNIARKNEEKALQKEIFNTTDEDLIKLSIYRTLSSVYDKWVGGTNGEVFNQCGVNASDIEISKKEKNSDTTSLIDSFRFLDRAFNNIGDKFYINPVAFNTYMRNDYNKSLFEIINKLLSDNNFNFIPLPNFVNFNEPTELANVFKPYPWIEYADNGASVGPAFVCVYVGQTSTGLDLGEDSNYPDDGIYIDIESGEISIDSANAASDFNNAVIPGNGDMHVPIFAVNYGQQNQNFFKNIKLDQREFTETAESLQIIEDISDAGNEKKAVYGGQNLFNVYQKRSYSAEVEMMGNAVIQPMMYFQLSNIPMFRGMYLIIKVNHSIKANSMKTTFKGVRVKKTKTPLLDRATLFMKLLGDLNPLSIEEIESKKNITQNAELFKYQYVTRNALKNKANLQTGFINILLGAKTDNDLPDNIKDYVDVKDTSVEGRYGMFEVIRAVQRVAYKFNLWWETQNKIIITDGVQTSTTDKNTGIYKLRINDISKLGGGIIGKHMSHQLGTDVDITPIRIDGKFQGVTIDNPEYDRVSTRKLAELFMEEKYEAYNVGEIDVDEEPAVDVIYFNDASIYTDSGTGVPGVNPLKDHDNHLHVRFNIPKRAIEESQGYVMNSRGFGLNPPPRSVNEFGTGPAATL